MLEQIRQSDELALPPGTCPCRLSFPESARWLLETKGVMPSMEGDGRRFPRHRTQGWAVLEYQPTFPSLQRPAELHPVLLVNISRGGVAFLHSEQLFPLEHLLLTLHNGTPRTVKVLHCRQLDPCCYLFGCEFVKVPE